MGLSGPASHILLFTCLCMCSHFPTAFPKVCLHFLSLLLAHVFVPWSSHLIIHLLFPYLSRYKTYFKTLKKAWLLLIMCSTKHLQAKIKVVCSIWALRLVFITRRSYCLLIMFYVKLGGGNAQQQTAIIISSFLADVKFNPGMLQIVYHS